MGENQILFIFIIMLLSGCSSFINSSSPKPSQRFEKVFTETHLIKSKTTKTDVIALYGTTRDKTFYPDNTEIWSYYADQPSPETVTLTQARQNSSAKLDRQNAASSEQRLQLRSILMLRG